MHDHDRQKATAVIEISGVQWASEKSRVEAILGRRPGIVTVDANPVAQTATVTYDPTVTSVAEMAGWFRDCGYHCAGQSVPSHLCDPLAEPAPPPGGGGRPAPTDGGDDDRRHEPATGPVGSPHDAMGHDGQGSMSMAAMAADMRNRFLVAAIASIPIVLWSSIGRNVLGFHVAAPFGWRDDQWQLLWSLPVIFWSARIFFVGAVVALRARTLDMMVLVAVAVGTGWVCPWLSP